jgi:2-dehydropantoate 2-reductase
MARICVAGVGAVGTTVATCLAAAGEHVSLLARGARLAQLRRGLELDFAGETVTAHADVSDRPEFGIQDIVFVATKAPSLAALVPTLLPLIGAHTLVVPLVNGIPWWYFQGGDGRFTGARVSAVDPDGTLARSIDPACIVGCVVYLTASLATTGRVTVMGGQRLIVGEITSGAITSGPSTDGETGGGENRGSHSDGGVSARIEALAALLRRAGLETTASARIRNDLWTKVALNLATNPLSVVTEATLLDLFTDPRLLPIVGAVLEEASRVARGYGAEPMSLSEMQDTGRRAGAFETSMLQDYRAGRPLELDAIGSSVLELARKIGEHMPATQFIVDLCAHRAARRGLAH